MNKFSEIDARYGEVLRSHNGGFAYSPYLVDWVEIRPPSSPFDIGCLCSSPGLVRPL